MPYLDLLRTKTNQSLISTKENWLAAWRELAELTLGIEEDDTRFYSLNLALDACEQAYTASNWALFKSASRRIKNLVQDPPKTDVKIEAEKHRV